MFLTIKKIPKNYWSSRKPLNFKPKALTVFYLIFGLSIFGLGEGLLIVSYSGASPWSVLAQGISLNIDLNNSKDRAKLKHILLHEPYRIRKKDLIYYKEVLEKTKIKFD